MTQALYAHMNNKTIKIKKKKENLSPKKKKQKQKNKIGSQGTICPGWL
jgi:hypothetical protein